MRRVDMNLAEPEVSIVGGLEFGSIEWAGVGYVENELPWAGETGPVGEAGSKEDLSDGETGGPVR